MKKLTLALLVGATLLSQATTAAAAVDQRTVAYMTSWGLDDSAVASLEKSKIDTFLLAFARWDKNGIITSSDNIATLPSYDPWWMDTGYISWTQLKKARPEKKMMVAFGGQTYDDMWAYLDTPERRKKIVEGILQLLNTSFPVYKKNLKPSEMVGGCLNYTWDHSACDMTTYQRAGYVFLDGIDFDFEKSERMTEEENKNLLLLVKELRSRLGDSRQISLTTYHVGADPVNCEDSSVYENCSYTESKRSVHNGEVLHLLTQGKNEFDFFNVMTYDAGKNFDYKTAMANYKKAVGGASKILLGNTINTQWDQNMNFVESRENNLERSKWQASKNYGGFFVWAVGANNAQLSIDNQVEYINAMHESAEQGSKLILDEIINSVTIKASTITVNMRKDVFYDNHRIILKRNNNYVAEAYGGKAYYAVKEKDTEDAVTFSTLENLKEGDVITVEYHNGWPGTSTTSFKQKVLAEVKVTKAMITADKAKITSVNVKENGIEVIMPKETFMKDNRLIIRQNGKYKGEVYSGVNYYSTKSTTSSGDILVRVNTTVNTGDEITVTHNAGKPGLSTSLVFETLYQKKARFYEKVLQNDYYSVGMKF